MTELFHKKSGAGFPVILLHGFCETHEIWDDFTDLLSPECIVISVDLPGFGKSPSLKAGASIEAVADQVLLLLKSLTIKKCIVIGHSLGGYVMLSMIEKNPDVFAGCCLFHSTALPDTAERKSGRNDAIKEVTNNGKEGYITNLIKSLFYKKDSTGAEKALSIALQTPQETVIGYLSAMRDRPDRLKVLQSTKNPVLFIGGAFDTVVLWESVQTQASEVVGSRAIRLPETGHMGMLEAPENASRKVIEWLKSFPASVFTKN